MKHEMTLFHTMGNVLSKTHLLFVTIYGLIWSHFNIRWHWSIWKSPITARPTSSSNVFGSTRWEFTFTAFLFNIIIWKVHIFNFTIIYKNNWICQVLKEQQENNSYDNLCKYNDQSHKGGWQSNFFHNSHLIRQIEQNIFQKFRDLTRNWTQIACLAVNHSNHYTRMFSVLVWGCDWTLFIHGWSCPICLIHLIGLRSLHFEKELHYVK